MVIVAKVNGIGVDRLEAEIVLELLQARAGFLPIRSYL